MSLPQPSNSSNGLASTAAGWLALVLSETLAQVALKAAGFRLSDEPFGLGWLLRVAAEPLAWVGGIAYLAAFAAWMTILDRLPLSKGFPLTAVIYVVVTGASIVIFREDVGVLRGLGIAMICTGVAVVGTEAES